MDDIPMDRKVDPKKVFEFLSKNYDSWSKSIHNKKYRFLNPNGDVVEGKSDPIYDYNLLDIIEQTVTQHPNFFPDWVEPTSKPTGKTPSPRCPNCLGFGHGIEECASPPNFLALQNGMPQQNNGQSAIKSENGTQGKIENNGETADAKDVKTSENDINKRSIKYPSKSFLKNAEMEYLRQKISQLMTEGAESKGFSLYDTKDEEGLHDYDVSEDDTHGDDDYDIDEVNGDYRGTEHHIELELQPECEIHGTEPCECEIYDDEMYPGEEYDFTFEYNEDGKLVPTFDGVKEYLKQVDNNKNMELKPKKPKKPKKKLNQPSRPIPKFNPDTFDNCLFCDYEAVFGRPPSHLMNWVYEKVEQEESKHHEIRKKLQSARSKALKKQRELRAKQMEQLQAQENSVDAVYN